MSRWSFLCGCALVISLAAGCASYRAQHFNETSYMSVQLDQANYRVSQLGVQSSASVGYLFPLGIGDHMYGIPLGKTDLLERAMRDIHAKCNLKGRSALLHNINVEWNTTRVFFLGGSRQLTVTADVVEFIGDYMDYKPRP